MNFVDIQKSWASAHNQPAPAELARAKARLTATLARRHRGFIALLAPPLGLLAVFSGLLVWRLARGLPFDITREWSALLLLALPWIAAGLLIRRYRQHRARHPDYAQSIGHSLRALLDENRVSTGRIKGLVILHLVSLPLLVLSIRQLTAAGKARPHEVQSMIILFAVLISTALLGLGLWYWRKLRPERAQLQELLRGYEQG